jgi:hypothetical protein
MTDLKHGDRVRYAGLTGTVDKHIPAQGRFHEACVVDWDDGTRTTVWATDLVREES